MEMDTDYEILNLFKDLGNIIFLFKGIYIIFKTYMNIKMGMKT